jgi:hypothetical protein
LKGAVVSAEPESVPSTSNCTLATARLPEADAVAATAIVPLTVAPATGEVMDTVGGVLPGGLVIEEGLEPPQPIMLKTSAPNATDSQTFRPQSIIPSPSQMTTLDYRRNASKQ